MVKEIYFTTISGKIVNNYDIAKAAIINGDTIDKYNFDDVRKYAVTCKGIIKEINPSIKVCLQNGDRINAIKLYYLRHQGITLKDAKNAIDEMEEKMKEAKMKIDDHNVTFKVTTYADMFKRKAVLAIEKETGELYGDVTINLPQYSLDDGESFLSADYPELIKTMVDNGYLEIVGDIQVSFGTYKIGKFTQKFADEFEK